MWTNSKFAVSGSSGIFMLQVSLKLANSVIESAVPVENDRSIIMANKIIFSQEEITTILKRKFRSVL